MGRTSKVPLNPEIIIIAENQKSHRPTNIEEKQSRERFPLPVAEPGFPRWGRAPTPKVGVPTIIFW